MKKARVEENGKMRAGNASKQRKSPTSKIKSPNSLSSGIVANPKCDAPEAIRIVVVDDHPLFRHGLGQLLNSDDGFRVCGEASSAPEALALIRKLKPDMAIVDLGLKGP